MKKCLLLMCLVISGCSAFSQLNKGQWLAGGNAGFSYTRMNGVFLNGNKQEQITIQVSPGAGYFFTDKLAAGARVNYSNTNYFQNTGGYSYFRQYSLASFVRYYFLPKAEKVNLFADLSYSQGYVRYHFPPSSNGTKGYTITDKENSYSIIAGPVIFLNPKTALELTVSFTKNGIGLEYNGRSTITILGGVGFQIHLGK